MPFLSVAISEFSLGVPSSPSAKNLWRRSFVFPVIFLLVYIWVGSVSDGSPSLIIRLMNALHFALMFMESMGDIGLFHAKPLRGIDVECYAH